MQIQLDSEQKPQTNGWHHTLSMLMSLLETKIENNIDLMTRADLCCKCLKTDVHLEAVCCFKE